jgi:2-polyprenyl-3-methyl-5-hydroxy-6-metoxy-1,4-benzoquinol methylase
MNRREACVLCRTPISHSKNESDGYRICQTCDVTWCTAEDPLNPIEEWETSYYGQNEILKLHEIRKSGMVQIIARLSRVRPQRGRLLDIGAGIGILMDAAIKDGWVAEGVEPSATAAERARKRTGAVVHEGLLEDTVLSEGCYDAVTILDILRSVPDPLKFLVAARRVLRPGGVLLIRENYRRIVQRSKWLIGRTAGSHHLKNERRAYEYAQCFSPKSLMFALSKVGLDGWVEPSPVFVESAPKGGFIPTFAKRVVGAASATVYIASGHSLIVSPNLLAFGEARAEHRP